ncbi:MAG: hypothetical protein EOO20_25625 [Chryseobacterium sp.]|nr:MAG: hypothetical protein EOO20_25625 [Chryseobacterium sp.]
MPPVAGLLKLVCGMRIPDLVDKDVFDKERIKTLMKWVTVTNRKKEFFDTNYLKVLRSIMDPIHDQTDWSIDLQVVNWYVNFERTGAGYILHSYFVDLTLDGDPANEWQSQHVNVTHKEEYLFQEIFDTIGVNTSPGSDSKLAAYFPEYSLMTN